MKNLLILVAGVLFLSFSWAQKTGKTYGLILSGGAQDVSNHYRYFENTKNLYDAFVKNGVSKADIYTLYASGNSNELDTRKKGVREKDFTNAKPNLTFSATSEFKKNGVNVNGAASVEDFKKSVDAIAKKAKPGDVVSLFVTDHGSSDGSVVMWGTKDKLAANKTAKDKQVERENPGYVSQEANKMSVAQMREILKAIPPGVTVQIANNICYGGAMVQLTDPDAGICVMSQVDDKRPSRSEVDTAPFALGYINNLGEKSFEEAYMAAQDADFFEENVGSMNSMDYFIDRELKKMPVANMALKNNKIICEPSRADVDTHAIGSLADNSAQESLRIRIEAASKKIKWLEGKKSDFDYNAYNSKRNDLQRQTAVISKMKEGPEKDKARAKRTEEADALEYEKTRYEVRIENLKKSVQSYKNQIAFLDYASPKQKEQYIKLKKCMERSI